MLSSVMFLCLGCHPVTAIREANARHARAKCWVDAQQEASQRAGRLSTSDFPVPVPTPYESNDLLKQRFIAGYRCGLWNAIPTGAPPRDAFSNISPQESAALENGSRQGTDDVKRRREELRLQVYLELLKVRGLGPGMPTTGEVEALQRNGFRSILATLLVFALAATGICGLLSASAKRRRRQTCEQTPEDDAPVAH